MKKITIYLFLILFFIQNNCLQVFAYDSFEEILEKEKKLKLQQKIEKNQNIPQNQQYQQNQYSPLLQQNQNMPQYQQELSTINISAGSLLNLRMNSIITDKDPAGTPVSFNLTNDYKQDNQVILPKGTVFQGNVADVTAIGFVGKPSIITLNINKLIYNNKQAPISTEIVSINNKKAYNNSIIGQSAYWKKVDEYTLSALKKAKFPNVPTCYVDGGIVTLPWLFGAAGYWAVKTAFVAFPLFLAAPIRAMGTEGEEIKLLNGTPVKIKLLQPAQINP